jgi:hypothetical protein
VQELHEAATQLHEAKAPEVQSLGARLQDILARAADGALASMFGSLAVELAKVQALVTSLKEAPTPRSRPRSTCSSTATELSG